MYRKTVFRGSFFAKDLTDGDLASLDRAFAILDRLSGSGAIEFQRGAGKTTGPERKPHNVLTPQAVAILRHLESAGGELVVSDVTSALAMNRNSVTAHLFRLASTGHLARRPANGQPLSVAAGHRANWTYAITELGRQTVLDLAPEPGEARRPGP